MTISFAYSTHGTVIKMSIIYISNVLTINRNMTAKNAIKNTTILFNLFGGFYGFLTYLFNDDFILG